MGMLKVNQLDLIDPAPRHDDDNMSVSLIRWQQCWNAPERRIPRDTPLARQVQLLLLLRFKTSLRDFVIPKLEWSGLRSRAPFSLFTHRTGNFGHGRRRESKRANEDVKCDERRLPENLPKMHGTSGLRKCLLPPVPQGQNGHTDAK